MGQDALSAEVVALPAEGLTIMVTGGGTPPLCGNAVLEHHREATGLPGCSRIEKTPDRGLAADGGRNTPSLALPKVLCDAHRRPAVHQGVGVVAGNPGRHSHRDLDFAPMETPAEHRGGEDHSAC